MKRLYRSRSERQIAGICGGLGEYFEVDPTIIRIFAVVFGLATGIIPFLIGYIVAWFIIPEQSQ